MDALVSIIIPTKNRQNIVTDAVRSALEQTHTQTEVIVVDDASGDNTQEVLRREFGNRITIIRRAHSGGPAAARNSGAKAARGNYLLFLDDDDLLLPWAAESLLKILSKHRCVGIAFGDGFDVRNGRVCRTFLIQKPSQGRVFFSLLRSNFIAGSGTMVTRKVWLECGGFRENFMLAQDYEFFLRVSRRYPVFFTRNPVWVRRILDEGRSKVLSQKRWHHFHRFVSQAKLSVLKEYKGILPLDLWMYARLPRFCQIAFFYLWRIANSTPKGIAFVARDRIRGHIVGAIKAVAATIANLARQTPVRNMNRYA